MSIKKSILIELERETHNTGRILERITDEHLDWRPHEKSRSLGELAAHIVELHNWVSKALSNDVFDFNTDYQPLKINAIEELKGILAKGLIANQEMIEQLPEEYWLKEWVLKAGDYEMARMPKVGAVRYIITNHLIHHRGQLTVYLRLLNIPVPGLYGPSADE
ncbi:DinB family protein [Sphingobacterium sp. SG20118]|uniref:DinB family protein n=1 Tax=Sphingobacterium sp. SG20118 TaxID=3367156 RepID=UPI0037DFBE25